MRLFSSILCAVDFSAHSRHALKAAAQLAARQHASLTAVTVVDPLLIPAAAAGYDIDEATADARQDLVAFVADTLTQRPLTAEGVRIEVSVGRPVREILRTAETVSADLLAVGTHGLGGTKKLFFGSTTERVLHDAGTAVLAVPLPQAPVLPEPLDHVHTVVMPIALDRDSTWLAAQAAQLAASLQAQLLLVHVVEPPQLPPWWRKQAPLDQSARLATAQRGLATLARVASRQTPVQTDVAFGEPPIEIARIAGERDAGMIVVGFGLPRSLRHRPGTTAYRIVRSSPVPVLALAEHGD
jgi:nucleotide-binding universal stress UspA family protein